MRSCPAIDGIINHFAKGYKKAALEEKQAQLSRRRKRRKETSQDLT
jgi:hypothetical protein